MKNDIVECWMRRYREFLSQYAIILMIILLMGAQQLTYESVMGDVYLLFNSKYQIPMFS